MIDSIDSTAIVTDIRNFSSTFKFYQNKNDDRFLKFLEEYYRLQNSIATIISKDIYISSTGDGVLTIFLSENNVKEGFAYMLITHKLLHNMCNTFNDINKNTNISFGIGADSGNVWNVGKGKLKTLVGTVINRASRIEGLTKMFANTMATIGNSMYSNIIKEFYPSYYDMMKKCDNYDVLLDKNPESILISKQFMLQYIFDMELNGIQKNAPIFRLSESLLSDSIRFNRILNDMIGESKLKKLNKIIK